MEKWQKAFGNTATGCHFVFESDVGIQSPHPDRRSRSSGQAHAADDRLSRANIQSFQSHFVRPGPEGKRQKEMKRMPSL
jgi:hypothetical protein